MSPIASSTSDGSSNGCAPSAMSALVPAAAGLRREPGIASTGRPYSSARSAVMRAPPRNVASTTTTTSASAAMIRFRTGKRARPGLRPYPSSLTSRPDRGPRRTTPRAAVGTRRRARWRPRRSRHRHLRARPGARRRRCRCEPAHDGDAGLAQRDTDLVRVGEPVRRGRTRADDGDSAARPNADGASPSASSTSGRLGRSSSIG